MTGFALEKILIGIFANEHVDFSKTVFNICGVIPCESHFVQRIRIKCFNYGIYVQSQSIDTIYFSIIPFHGAPKFLFQ